MQIILKHDVTFQNDCNGFHLSLHDSMKYNSERVATYSSTKCFVPLCVCFISSKPYFDVLKTTLSWFVTILFVYNFLNCA